MFLSLKILTFQNKNLDFLISWWTSFIFWHVLMNCDFLHLILTIKSKFDFSVYSWLLISWLKIHLSIQLILSNVLGHAIRSKLCNWTLEIMLKVNWSFSRSKIRNYPFLAKTLILTILPFWWFDQISWGIVVQTWSNDIYESKMLMWIENYEVWL